MEGRMTLYELFGPVTKRLYDLKNKTNLDNETYLGILGDGYKRHIAAILGSIFEYEDNAAIDILNRHLTQIDEIKDLDFTDAIDIESYSIDTVKHEIQEELDHYQQNFNKVIEALNDRLKNANSRERIKTTLNVSELAYLFRMLNDVNIFEIRNKTDLYRFIATNFQSKKATEISGNSIKNKFDTPDANAMEYWEEKLHHILTNVRKDRKKY